MNEDEWDVFPQADHPLDSHLGGVLKGQGSAFEDAGHKYGVDPMLLAAIATLESGHGTSHAAVAYNNPTGMMDPNSKDQKQFIRYDSIPDAIEATARNLSQNYLQQGLSTIDQIASKYSPSDAKNDPHGTNREWPGQVRQIYQKMGGTQEYFGPAQVAKAIPIMRGDV
jgi:beta-N-acetylglucosaminidase